MNHRDQAGAQRRREQRIFAALRVSTTFVDPVRDPITREVCYQMSDEDTVLNVSRRGAGLHCVRPPEVGTRLLLEIRPPGMDRSFEMMGRARWTRVEYVPGTHGARAVAAVGVELIGGSHAALDRYESWLASFGSVDKSVARLPTLR
jgi:hypothetical protein